MAEGQAGAGGDPLLSAIPLITVPQFFMLKYFTDKLNGWDEFSLYQKLNVTVWELVSHLWFLLTLSLLRKVRISGEILLG